MSRDDDRQFGLDREADRLGLEIHAGAGSGGDRDRAAESGADCGAHAGDLVLGLEGIDGKFLEARELMQDVAGRGDRVRTEEQRTARAFTAAATKPSAVALLPVMLR